MGVTCVNTTIWVCYTTYSIGEVLYSTSGKSSGSGAALMTNTKSRCTCGFISLCCSISFGTSSTCGGEPLSDGGTLVACCLCCVLLMAVVVYSEDVTKGLNHYTATVRTSVSWQQLSCSIHTASLVRSMSDYYMKRSMTHWDITSMSYMFLECWTYSSGPPPGGLWESIQLQLWSPCCASILRYCRPGSRDTTNQDSCIDFQYVFITACWMNVYGIPPH